MAGYDLACTPLLTPPPPPYTEAGAVGRVSIENMKVFEVSLFILVWAAVSIASLLHTHN